MMNRLRKIALMTAGFVLLAAADLSAETPLFDRGQRARTEWLTSEQSLDAVFNRTELEIPEVRALAERLQAADLELEEWRSWSQNASMTRQSNNNTNNAIERANQLWRIGGVQDFIGSGKYVVRGQSPDGGDGGGAGAAEATDPTALLTQLQIQNVMTFESFNGSGYANAAVIQPVLPFPVAMPGLRELFPSHIIRPTLPIPAPTADPDGPLGVQGGMGDLTILDVYLRPVEGFGVIGLGYTLLAPTSTDPQLGLGEWQFGPSAVVVYKEIPKTLLGFIYQQSFSLESDAQAVNLSIIAVRQLPDQWYVRWGEIFWTFNTKTGDYNIPLQIAVGKVVTVGNQPLNLFIEPFYTPDGLHSGTGGDQWGVKLNCTFLFPEKKLKPLLGFLWE